MALTRYVALLRAVNVGGHTAALIERRLGTSGTARNWNTVLKRQALASE